MGLTDSSNIRSTGLVNTKELFYLSDDAITANSNNKGIALQKAMFNTSESDTSGLTQLQQSLSTSDTSLQDALEKMFQNFTISLMTS